MKVQPIPSFASRLPPPWPLLIAATVTCALIACGGSSSNRESTVPDATDLPSYSAADEALFGDTIAPEIFDRPDDGRSALEDPKLIPRTEQADAVLRARIATITRDQLDDRSSYRFVLEPVDSELLGQAPSQSIELRLDPGNPAAPYVRNRQAKLTGKTVLLFLRGYNEQGQVVFHFHMQKADPEVVEAVKRAKALDDLDS